VVWGALLLLIYSIGYSTIMVIAGTSVGFVKQISQSEKYMKRYNVLKIVLGLMVLAIAFYLFYLGF